MTGFNHTLVGASIGLAVKQPFLIAPLAFASHIVCDSMPHFADEKYFKPFSKWFVRLLVFDAVICFSILGIMLVNFPSYWLALVVGMFFATLPDFLWIPYYIYKQPKLLFYRIHTVVQWGQRPYGWIYELIYFALFALLLFAITRTL